MTLAAATFSVTRSGTTWTFAPSSSPTPFQVVTWDLLRDPEERTGDVMRPDGGSQPGGDLSGGRMCTIDANAGGSGSTAAQILTARDLLAAAFARTSAESTLRFSVDGSTEYVYLGQTRGADTSVGVWLPTRCEFYATDSRRFSGVEHSGTVGTDATVSNAGNAPTIWRWEIAGPVTDPSLVLNGATYTFDGLTVGSGQTLIVSRRNRRATVAGVDKSGYAADGSGRMPWVWDDMAVGSNTLGGTTGGVFYWRDGWR